MSRWTEEVALKNKYDPSKAKSPGDSYYIWEGGTGFGMRLYASGRRTWQCASTVTNRVTGKHTSRFFTLGKIPDMGLKAARIEAEKKLGKMREGGDPRLDEKSAAELRREAAQSEEAAKLEHTTLKAAVDFYIDNRNCSPRSKKDLRSRLKSNVGDWMQKHLLEIDTVMLLKRYREILDRIKQKAAMLEDRHAKLPPAKRLLVSKPGYFNGIKAALDTVKCFGRVYRYWTRKHARQLAKAGIIVPESPTAALMDDLQPEQQRVKSIPIHDLLTLTGSYPSYPGNALHPLLSRLLLATGARVGALMALKKECIKPDRIEIPGDAERSKVRWNKRHLSHMTRVIPRTPEIDIILAEIESVAMYYGDADVWLFPSNAAESGHMEEEKAVSLGLRKHSGIRFTCHQFRHNFATAAEELGLSKGEIKELLGQGAEAVTDRYIDERVKRQRRQLMEIHGKIVEMLGRASEVKKRGEEIRQ